MIKQLAHICINTTDLEATKHFYTEAFGLSIAFEFEKNDAPFGFYVKLGNNTFIEVFLGDQGGQGNIQHIAIEVTDLDALTAQIRSHGYEVTEKKLGVDNTWQAWTTDPNGTKIEFQEYTEQSSQFTGRKCIANW